MRTSNDYSDQEIDILKLSSDIFSEGEACGCQVPGARCQEFDNAVHVHFMEYIELTLKVFV